MTDAIFEGGVLKPMGRNRLSTRSTRKSKSTINKPRRLVEELESRVQSHKIGDGVHELWKNEMKDNPTFFAFFRPENREKNLKKEVLLYDLTRVVLTGGRHDYYHASWVDGLGGEKEYILAQAPLKNTLEDFERLAQQTKPEVVVMLLGKESEESKLLWAGKKLASEKEPDAPEGWEVSWLTTGNQKIKVFTITGWLDDAKPPASLVDSIEKLRKRVPYETKSPILVICKDGVTRSGVFTWIDYEMERIKTKGCVVKLQETVRHLRQQRSNVLDSFELFDAGLQLIVELAKKCVHLEKK